ncbi:hypothetical protein Q3V23_23785 [Streptomyces sp. VNUA116]|uniref:hypothetical protein n=1 Tax=Streptomyces sp. VNUA116 TaxID=3062449 RepID=UPI002674CEA9|nr:hypothetical protein [Streptomyces sp. VNUA116]WKU46838.1 hypothetical protein Q3V23_23785 [Streptomyces sp. VNUA116]
MSRESDSSSSGPQGRGGAAYPSGTPPYGSEDQARAAAASRPEEPKTETTLTTRIRINIPGSRPIPPVIMRTPVEGEGAPASTPGNGSGNGSAPASGGSSTPAKQAPAAGGGAPSGERKAQLPRRTAQATPPGRKQQGQAGSTEQGGGKGEKASDWFAPRKGGGATPPPAGGRKTELPRRQAGAAAAGAGAPQHSGPRNTPPAPPVGQTMGGTPWPGDAQTTGSGSVPQQPRTPNPGNGWQRDTTHGAAAPQAGGPQAGGAAQRRGAEDDWPGGSSTTGATPWDAGMNTGMNDIPGAGAPGGVPGNGTPAGGMAQRRGTQDDWPGGPSASSAPVAPGPVTPAPGAPVDDWPGSPSTTASTPWPGDPSTTGSMPQPPAPGGGAPWPDDPMSTGSMGIMQPPAPGAPVGGGAQWTEPESTQQFPAPAMGGAADPFAPAGAGFGPTDTPHEGVPRVPAPPAGAQSAAAAAPPAAPGKAPQQPKGGKAKGGKKGGAKAPAAGARPAGETLVSGGVPVVPPPGPGAPQAGKPVDSGAPRIAVPKPKVPGPGAVPPPPAKGAPAGAAKGAPKSAPAKAQPKKKGRSKVVLLGGAVVGLVGAAYVAGLVLDHADVPNGTTVLGVNIGGSSKEQAVQKLDSALGDRATKPLKVSIGGKEAELKPSVAGLSIDTQATVRGAAGRDYNPLTVIPSLIGGTRTAEPVIVADEEKIANALKTLAGESGGAKDGTIKFEPGKAVPVYGKPYQGIDGDKGVDAVAKAYKDRAATGQETPVELPSASQQPKVTNAEVDRMMKEFAQPAMSGLVTVQTDPLHKIQFGPERSLPKILGVKEVGGKLVENYDLEAIKELYGTAFKGVLIQRGNGTKTEVTPQDVVGALRKALVGKTPAERVGTIPLS